MTDTFNIDYKTFFQKLEDDIMTGYCPFIAIERITRQFKFEDDSPQTLTYTFEHNVKIKIIMADVTKFEITDIDGNQLIHQDKGIQLTSDLSYARRRPSMNELIIRQDGKDVDDCLPAYFVQMLLHYGLDSNELSNLIEKPSSNPMFEEPPLSKIYIWEYIKNNQLTGELGSKLK